MLYVTAEQITAEAYFLATLNTYCVIRSILTKNTLYTNINIHRIS